MAWKPSIPEMVLAFYLVSIALELVLSRLRVVKARYGARDTLAAFGMSFGNILTNLMMAGIVFAGLSAAWKARLFTISPASPWAWAALFFLDDFTYYWFHRISHECRLWWAAHVNHHSSRSTICRRRCARPGPARSPAPGPRGSPWRCWAFRPR